MSRCSSYVISCLYRETITMPFWPNSQLYKFIANYVLCIILAILQLSDEKVPAELSKVSLYNSKSDSNTVPESTFITTVLILILYM